MRIITNALSKTPPKQDEPDPHIRIVLNMERVWCGIELELEYPVHKTFRIVYDEGKLCLEEMNMITQKTIRLATLVEQAK